MRTSMMMNAAVAVLVTLPGCGSSSLPKGHAPTAVETQEVVARAAPYRISGAAL